MADNPIKYRLRFAKDGAMIYVGHLDLLKLFQRAIRRANLPVAYSGGFNPHQLISFAHPLPIGYSSAAEYTDITFAREPGDIVKALARQLPEGLRPIHAHRLNPGEKPGAALTAAALYEITLPEPIALSNAVERILAADALVTVKKTKSGEAEANIRPDIISLTAHDEHRLSAMLAAGSGRNLKPELLCKYIYGLAGADYEPLAVKYLRAELFRLGANGYISLKGGD